MLLDSSMHASIFTDTSMKLETTESIHCRVKYTIIGMLSLKLRDHRRWQCNKPLPISIDILMETKREFDEQKVFKERAEAYILKSKHQKYPSHVVQCISPWSDSNVLRCWDFHTSFEQICREVIGLSYDREAKEYHSRLSVSEVMTIVPAFHGSGFCTFKDFYTRHVMKYWHSALPNLVNYPRFVELMPWSVMPLACCLQTTFSDLTGIDSTSLEICYPNRAK